MRRAFAALCLSLSTLVVTHAAPVAAPWWQHAVIYEIYPRSFGDSNGDGVGDLNGITQHLDYLQELGVDAIWIAPMYPSPQVDFGYDISDYENVDPQYGTLKDFDRLQAEAGKHHIRIVLDMVLNHTSDKDAWFVESSGSRNNPRADWYVWNDGLAADAPGVTDYQKKFGHEGRVPPNNWTSIFGGSAWEWSPVRKQFYYHKFYKQQPDLNWRNPAVEKAMFGAMKFWLDRGVAGFRLDAIPALFEDTQLRNEPEAGGTTAQGDPKQQERYSGNLPEVHDTLRRLRAMVDTYPGHRVLIGETYPHDTAELDAWYGGEKHDQLQLPMDMLVGFGEGVHFDAGYFRHVLEASQTKIHGSQSLLVFDNHDSMRSIDRFGDGKHDIERAKIIATLLLASRATALTYYGAPLGMRTMTPTRREDVKDPAGITGWPLDKGRDGERTPMQWTAGPQAGFSTQSKTWLPVSPNHTTLNVQAALADPASLLNWYKRLIALRRDNEALRNGDMTMLDRDNPDVLSFVRKVDGKLAVVAMNLSGETTTVVIESKALGTAGSRMRTLAASDASIPASVPTRALVLPAYSAWIGEP